MNETAPIPGVLSRELRKPARDDGPVLLVASNGGARALPALRKAAALAAERGGTLVCERIVDEGTPREGGEAALGAFSSEVEPLVAGRPIGCLAEVCRMSQAYTDDEFGRAVTLADAATRHGATLIVIGVHGGSGGGRTLSTTMTEKLLKVAPCPVLIVTGGEEGPYRRVLAAVDFSEVSLREMEAAMRFGPQAEMTVVHVAGGDDDPAAREADLLEMARTARKNVERDAPDAPTIPDQNISVRIMRGAPGDAINELVSEIGPDLLVLGTKGRTGLARLVLGSVATRFIANPPSDLLVLRSV